jgi:trimeric autotransporter adhesin
VLLEPSELKKSALEIHQRRRGHRQSVNCGLLRLQEGQKDVIMVNRYLPSVLALALLFPPVHAAQPPDVVVSDASGNTAGGTSALSSLQSGYDNSAFGGAALSSDTSGFHNTAMGNGAASGITSGFGNTAVGSQALNSNFTGNGNTAIGNFTLTSTDASENTAIGYAAMGSTTSGVDNTGTGAFALSHNLTGSNNTAIGHQAMFDSQTGSNNTAIGHQAMFDNQTGGQNTAIGKNALYHSTSSANTVAGYSACWACRTGGINTGYGFKTLFSNATGSNNIALGYEAAFNVQGSNNIDIGNQGMSGDNGVIRIGAASTQSTTYIAGINSTTLTGSAVYVNSNGQLGVVASSERYKTEITSMDANTDKLQQLRPVTFRLKSEPRGTLQYGLIAEEVQKIYPDLVIRNSQGRIEGIRYDELTPILLKEIQVLRAHQIDIDRELKKLTDQSEGMRAIMEASQSFRQSAATR